MGEGELRSEIEHASRQEPAIRARILGFKNQTEMSRYFHASDVLILPSAHSETWGLVVNEALHHGVPCIVSDAVGCAPDLIHPTTGMVCRTGSVEALAEAIGNIVPMLKRSETREACRGLISYYRVADAARGIAEAFESTLAVLGTAPNAINVPV